MKTSKKILIASTNVDQHFLDSKVVDVPNFILTEMKNGLYSELKSKIESGELVLAEGVYKLELNFHAYEKDDDEEETKEE